MPTVDKSLADRVRREATDAGEAALIVVYDGQCPFCSAVSDYVALRARHGVIHQVDARRLPALVAAIQAAGHDLDRDFLVVHGDDLYFGADGVRALSQADLGTGWPIRAMRRLFGKEGQGARLYRTLNFGRRGLLKILRRPGL